MKKSLVLIGGLILLVSLSYGSQEYYSYSYARLSYVKGDVFIQRAEDLGYEEGVVNLALIEGEKIGTREGLAEIHFGRRNYLRIDGHTQLDLVGLPERENDLIQLHLLSGSLYLRVNYLEREKDFEIHTPDASFYILDTGLYRIDVREDRETEFLVLEGAAEASGEEGSVLVESQDRVVASNGYLRDEPRYASASYEDAFSRWNASRDALRAEYNGKRYLPDELYEYEHELAENGRWIYERPYGYVWVPSVYRSSWRPYHYGRWVWYPIIGWNWVSYDPWGWCVHHYGRWHWRIGLGWYWIPTRHWGPAWVHWHHGYDYYGWSPLSYYGYPAVIINNRFYGRYYQRNYPIHSRALTVIHKRQLQARHISKVALSRSDISRLGKISLSATKIKARPVIDKAGLKNSKAAKVLSRSDVRKVTKGYSSGKSSSLSSKLKSTKIKSQPSALSRSSRITPKKSTVKSPSRVTERRSKLSKIRTYPSKKSSDSASAKKSTSVSRSRVNSSPPRVESNASSRKSVKTYSSRSSTSPSRSSRSSSVGSSKARSSKTPSRSSPKSYTSSKSRPSVKSRVSTPKRTSSSSLSRSYSSSRTSSSSSVRSSKARSSKAPSRSSSRSYTSSRSKTSVKSRASTPKRSAAPSRSKASSSSRVSRSSSSSSSSSKKVKK